MMGTRDTVNDWLEKRREKARAEGRVEGIAKGRVEGRAELAAEVAAWNERRLAAEANGQPSMNRPRARTPDRDERDHGRVPRQS